jgi:hypothetical protein
MRTLRLARIAAEAEGLRLRQQAKRTVIRGVLGVVALVFLAGALAFAHIAAWFWLRLDWEARHASLILAGADLVLAALLGLLAARSSPGRVEREALAVRRRAIDSATSPLALSVLAMPALRVLGNLMWRRRSRR